jgi:hypothetical protein
MIEEDTHIIYSAIKMQIAVVAKCIRMKISTTHGESKVIGSFWVAKGSFISINFHNAPSDYITSQKRVSSYSRAS